MTDPQAAREQAAREWLEKRGFLYYESAGQLTAGSLDDVVALAALLASTEVRMLNEVKDEIKARRCVLAGKMNPGRPLFSGQKQTYEGEDESLRLLSDWVEIKAQERTP